MPAPTARAEVKADEEGANAAGCEKRRRRGLCQAAALWRAARRCGKKACFSEAQKHAAPLPFAAEGAADSPVRAWRGKRSFRTGSQGALMRPPLFPSEHIDVLLR